MKIGIVGSGISGLSAAFFLKDEHEITIFEKENRFGGHANTRVINYNGLEINVDTGFIVFNYKTYYHLQRLFKVLNVEIGKSEMSFGVSNDVIEYSSVFPIGGLKNILNFKHLKMLFEVYKFNKIANKNLPLETETIEDFLNRFSFSDYFRKNYVYSMVGAIWSCNLDDAKFYPASSFIDFFKNHGLLQIINHPQWYYVKGGSRQYVEKIRSYKEITFKNEGITKIIPHDGKVKVCYNESEEIFDKVIVATHADEAFELTSNEILKDFKYTRNRAVLHKSTTFMPKNHQNRASWNVISQNSKQLSLTYYMNILQEIPKSHPLFVTLNPVKQIDEQDVFYETTYTHPFFDFNALKVQKEISKIQGAGNIYYVGAYLGYGFHEDGIKSSYDVCKTLVKKMPW
jgi:predicted NAD/FAD-binding protein